MGLLYKYLTFDKMVSIWAYQPKSFFFVYSTKFSKSHQLFPITSDFLYTQRPKKRSIAKFLVLLKQVISFNDLNSSSL